MKEVFKERLNTAEAILDKFCKVFDIPLVRENNGELPNLSEQQIANLLMIAYDHIGLQAPSKSYIKNCVIPNIIKRQNSEPNWWLRQMCLYLRAHGE